MKKNIAWTVAAVAAFASFMVLPYLEGRSNDWWVIPPLIPADLLPPLVLLISCIALLASWLRSLFPPAQPTPDKRHRVAKGLLFLLSALLLGGTFFLPAPAQFFHRGFNVYARTVLTPEEWRQIARYAQAHPIPVKDTPGVATNSPSEDEIEALHAALRSETPFRKLDRHPRIWVDGENTDIYWGGALVGHRYVVVMAHPGGEKGDTRFVAEDIVTYIDD